MVWESRIPVLLLPRFVVGSGRDDDGREEDDDEDEQEAEADESRTGDRVLFSVSRFRSKTSARNFAAAVSCALRVLRDGCCGGGWSMLRSVGGWGVFELCEWCGTMAVVFLRFPEDTATADGTDVPLDDVVPLAVDVVVNATCCCCC